MVVDNQEFVVSQLDFQFLPTKVVVHGKLQLLPGTLGFTELPFICYRSGNTVDPVVGITCAIHGNEINGIAVIHRLLRDGTFKLDKGTLIAFPVINVPGFLASERLLDNQDLNRLMPGKIDGAESQQYAYYVFEKIVRKLDIMIDLHTASQGRQNSLYVRADMNDEVVARMAYLLNPQIIVHNSRPGGSMRGAAAAIGVKAITVEIANPSVFQQEWVERVTNGTSRILRQPSFDGDRSEMTAKPVVCSSSRWLFTKFGGLVCVFTDTIDKVKKGEKLAEVVSLYGKVVEEIFAPYDCVVIGRQTNPVITAGGRVVHIGIEGKNFDKHVDDGHM